MGLAAPGRQVRRARAARGYAETREAAMAAFGEQVVNRRQPHAVRRLDQIPKSSLSVLAVEAIDCALARSSAPFFGVEKP